jgi:Fe-S oxidoreductase
VVNTPDGIGPACAGCCGMAGSFGFEQHKYALSQTIGERALLPAVRNADADTFVIADGFSCREQILQGCGRRSLHLAEVLQRAIRHGQSPPVDAEPSSARQRKNIGEYA